LESIKDLDDRGLILDSRDRVHNAKEFLNELHNFE